MVAWEKEIIITFSNEMKLITESESEPQYPVLFLFLLPYSHGWSSVAAILVLSAYQSASAQCPLFDYIGILFYISSVVKGDDSMCVSIVGGMGYYCGGCC